MYVGISAIILALFSAVCLCLGVYTVNFWLDVFLILINFVAAVILLVGLYIDKPSYMIPFIVTETAQTAGFFVLACYTFHYTFISDQTFLRKFDQMLMVVSIYVGVFVAGSAIWAAAKCYHYMRAKQNGELWAQKRKRQYPVNEAPPSDDYPWAAGFSTSSPLPPFLRDLPRNNLRSISRRSLSQQPTSPPKDACAGKAPVVLPYTSKSKPIYFPNLYPEQCAISIVPWAVSPHTSKRIMMTNGSVSKGCIDPPTLSPSNRSSASIPKPSTATNQTVSFNLTSLLPEPNTQCRPKSSRYRPFPNELPLTPPSSRWNRVRESTRAKNVGTFRAAHCSSPYANVSPMDVEELSKAINLRDKVVDRISIRLSQPMHNQLDRYQITVHP